ncbi:transcriptional regulator PpsR [Jannaschia donghaensis]|uniref:Transcriptional regulator PpsR n=1 Tax=Jannaschia donghaensis TaxID=420998 RepID=A0A0M6YE17_9RHOB|nr:transcriptional regulator PpsR [Jannaschia donghaensis]CTQ48009.1 transcriptional regulator PpsR [Jannaschia donghaensis]
MNINGSGAGAWFQGLLPDARSDILANLVAGVADMALLVSWNGMISDIRVRPGLDLGVNVEAWAGVTLQGHLTTESVPKLERCLEDLRQGSSQLPLSELNLHHETSGIDVPMSFSFHRIGHETDVLMLGRDLRPLAEVQQQLVAAQMAMERDYEAQRATETRLRVLMATTPDACLFINVARREVTEANNAASQLFGHDLPDFRDTAIESLLRAGPDVDLVEQLVATARQPDGVVSATLRIDGSDIDIAPTSFRIPGAHMLLCRVTSRRKSASEGETAADRLAAFYAASPDAIVFTTGDGRILGANGSFLDLVEMPQEDGVRDRSLADFLVRGSVDLSVLLANASRSGSLRLFSTKITQASGQGRSVEISVTRLRAGIRSIFGLVIRDTSRSTALRKDGVDPSVDLDSIVDLLGKQSLKDIVAQATDVIERMCIGAAVDLTSNNRVAAADMLGLSRQSLYVKLRKYGLLKRDSV